jgi:RecG-like helicase
VTLVPFHFGEQSEPSRIIPIRPRPSVTRHFDPSVVESAPPVPRDDGTIPIGSVRFRQRAQVRGKVRTVRVQPLAGTPTLECVLADETGQLSVVFLGRRHVAGISVGRSMMVEGVLGQHHGRLCFINPTYELVTG